MGPLPALARRTAAVVAIGTELVEGLSSDSNSAEIGAALTGAGLEVGETAVIPDDETRLASALSRLTSEYGLVVTTGGLGPTHDDVTRVAASRALGVPLESDRELEVALEPVAETHHEPDARRQVMMQALLLEGASVLLPTSGTAPGQVVPTESGALVLLPGPPHEMRPMLALVLGALRGTRAGPQVLACTGISESDAQVAASRTLAGTDGVGLTVLADVGEVRVVLRDTGAGGARLDEAAARVADVLGARCYSRDGRTLPEVVAALAASAGATIALAESCSGGLAGGSLTDVPGVSGVFLGSVVAYSDDAKTALLDVPASLIRRHGAVSAEVALAMAEGVAHRLDASHALSITGIAGPDGGSDDKPVGTVWFGVRTPGGSSATRRVFPGDRPGIRRRATLAALDLLRRALLDGQSA